MHRPLISEPQADYVFVASHFNIEPDIYVL